LYTAAREPRWVVYGSPPCNSASTTTPSTMYMLAYVNLRGWVMHDRVTHRCLSDAPSNGPSLDRPAIAVPGNGLSLDRPSIARQEIKKSRRWRKNANAQSLRGFRRPRLPSNVNVRARFKQGHVLRGRRCQARTTVQVGMLTTGVPPTDVICLLKGVVGWGFFFVLAVLRSLPRCCRRQ